MNSLSLRLPSRRTGYVAAVFTLLFATITSTFASAAQVTERSIALSDSTKSQTGVSYTVDFKPVSSATAVVIDFCSNSPLIGAPCTVPAGLDVKTSSPATIGGFTKDAASTANTLILTGGTLTPGTSPSLVITGVKNPSDNGTFFARILTYGTAGAAQAYASETPGTDVDDGGVALSIADVVKVSADVLESLTFCVSGEAVQILVPGCTGTLTAPTLKLGEPVGTVLALTTSNVSTGSIYTQLSTNAVGGAVVNLKSSADCGGLKRVGATVCDIAPAKPADTTFDDSTPGIAKFGVKLGTATNTSSGVSDGSLQAASANYDTSSYKMNFVTGNLSGVSSTYGDPLLNTAGAPVNNKVMGLTFGASIANNTPAGSYSADLNLIATGKF